jgi:hypothetical protein
VETKDRKQIVEELKEQWRTLWQERIDDKVKAEGISNKDYSGLFVEKGMIIFATRNFRMPTFREILQLHKLVDVDRFISPSPSVGGWGKFIRTVIVGQKPSNRAREAREQLENEKQRQQLKKGGRGWLHKV